MVLLQDTHKYFKFFEEPRYYNFLMDAWETRYGEQRAAAIDRLEQLCQEKHHLKLPSVSNNPNSKAKKKNVDVSQLKVFFRISSFCKERNQVSRDE